MQAGSAVATFCWESSLCNIPIWIISKQMSWLNTIVTTPDVLSELVLISMKSTTGLNNF